MAVRPSNRRLEKWDNFLSGDVLSVAVSNYKPKMKEQLSAIFPELEALENEVKIILSEAGTPSMFNPAYLNFAREVYRYAKKFSGTQLLREVDILMNKWSQRSLERDILERIRNTVFTLTAPVNN
ncbi:MAG: hypothetical protein NZ601_03810 [candidate division WOR-3 bacterium]|nr:hypothetical protein [candidate division WOR-3 bacterium]MDW7987915.1 hypothetical protein [candidate division WOR-3 bacterium]